jgi:hypothetical protein
MALEAASGHRSATAWPHAWRIDHVLTLRRSRARFD